MAPKAERYVAPPFGSTYTLAQTNTGSYGSWTGQLAVKVTERMWEGRQMIAFVTQRGTTLANTEGGWSTILGPNDTPILSWDPPLGYNWPLEVGKTWTKSYRVTIHPRNQTIPFETTFKVESYEDVTVPAGTFKVFKISNSTTVSTEGIQWFSPELGVFVKQSQKRAANAPLGLGTNEEELVEQTIRK
jgi:hypothetical protein